MAVKKTNQDKAQIDDIAELLEEASRLEIRTE